MGAVGLHHVVTRKGSDADVTRYEAPFGENRDAAALHAHLSDLGYEHKSTADGVARYAHPDGHRVSMQLSKRDASRTALVEHRAPHAHVDVPHIPKVTHRPRLLSNMKTGRVNRSSSPWRR
jgi:hypothetical protein